MSQSENSISNSSSEHEAIALILRTYQKTLRIKAHVVIE